MSARFPRSPGNKQGDKEWSYKYLGSQEKAAKQNPLEWWYRLTAPAVPSISANLEQREIARRGRLTSTILLFVALIIIALAMPVAVFQNHLLIPVFLGLIGLVATALLFNRSGKITIAGIFVVIGVDAGLATSLLTTPGGLHANSVPLYDLMVQAELVAVSLLPPQSVFIVALINSIFIWASLTYQPHTPDLNALLAFAGPEVLARPIVLEVIVAVVTYLWVRSAMQAIARADRAEVIASLEHAIAEQEHTVAQQKRQLDSSIQQIVDTHMRVANGDFSARVPLTGDNVLWQIAGSLNNLLSRLQRLRHFEQEIQVMQPQMQRLRNESQELYRTKEEIHHLATTIRRARAEKTSIPLTRTGTIVDSLIQELNAMNHIPSAVRLVKEKNSQKLQ